MPTTKIDPRANCKRLRYTYELLFALNLALVAELEGNQRPNRLFSFLEWSELDFRLNLAEYFHLHAHSDLASGIAFLLYSLGLALFIFLLLRVSAGTHVIHKLLRIGGILSLLAFPASWLIVTQRMGWWFTFLSATGVFLLVIELMAATFFAIAYLYARWTVPSWGNAALLLVHFSLWQVVCFGPYFWRGPTLAIVIFSGFFSALAWGIYTSRQRSFTTQAMSG